MEIPLILNISHYSILLPLLIGLSLYRVFNLQFKILVILFIFGSLAEFSGLVFQTSVWAMNIYDIIELILLVLVIHKFNDLIHFKNFSILFVSVTICMRLFLLIIGIDDLFNLNSYAQIASHLYLVVLSILNLSKMGKSTQEYLLKSPKFWVLTSVALYFSSTIFVVFSSFSIDSEPFLQIYKIHSFFNITCHLLYSYAFVLFYINSKLSGLINQTPTK